MKRFFEQSANYHFRPDQASRLVDTNSVSSNSSQIAMQIYSKSFKQTHRKGRKIYLALVIIGPLAQVERRVYVVNKKSQLYNGRNLNPLELQLVIQKGTPLKDWEPTEMECPFHSGRMGSQVE